MSQPRFNGSAKQPSACSNGPHLYIPVIDPADTASQYTVKMSSANQPNTKGI